MGACRALFAGVTLVAIATQMIDLAGKGILNPVIYFTIDSNLIAAAVLLAGAMARSEGASRPLDILRGGAVVYMSTAETSSTASPMQMLCVVHHCGLYFDQA